MQVENNLAWLILIWLLRPSATCDGEVLFVQRRILGLELAERIAVGSSEWRTWLEEHERFRYDGLEGRCVLQKELVNGRPYWRAYKWHTRRLKADRLYIGKLPALAPDAFRAKIRQLCDQAKARRLAHLADRARRRRLIASAKRRRRRLQAVGVPAQRRRWRERSYAGDNP